MTQDKIQNNTDVSEETQETDPLLALAGTLKYDVTEIKKRLKNTVHPNVRVVNAVS